MPTNPQVIRFKATLERFPGQGGIYHIRFPYVVEELFGTKGSVRVKGTLNGLPIDRALKPLGDGTHYLIINPDMRRQARIVLGSKVTVELWRNETPDELELPAELEAALELEPAARETFNQLNPSTRRQVAYWVDSAKGAGGSRETCRRDATKIAVGPLHDWWAEEQNFWDRIVLLLERLGNGLTAFMVEEKLINEQADYCVMHNN